MDIHVISNSELSQTIRRRFYSVAVFYNPHQNVQRLTNLTKFYDNLYKYTDRILIVEGIKVGQKSQIDAIIRPENLIKVEYKDDLWQKEALLNIAIKELPRVCTKVAWFDADILIEDVDFFYEAYMALGSYPIVQPFSHCVFMGRNSNIYNYTNKYSLPEGSDDHHRIPSIIYCLNNRISKQSQTPGFVWSADKDIIKKLKFYDRVISGDAFLLSAMFGQQNNFAAYGKEYLKWSKLVYNKIGGRVGHTSQYIYHMYHDFYFTRPYGDLFSLLIELGYNPEKDVRLSKSGTLEWTSRGLKNKKLQNWVKNYMSERGIRG